MEAGRLTLSPKGSKTRARRFVWCGKRKAFSSLKLRFSTSEPALTFTRNLHSMPHHTSISA